LSQEDISVRKTKEEKAMAKLKWKKNIIDGKGKCNVCAAMFSPTKRPVSVSLTFVASSFSYDN
jgi:hypothetical protein